MEREDEVEEEPLGLAYAEPLGPPEKLEATMRTKQQEPPEIGGAYKDAAATWAAAANLQPGDTRALWVADGSVLDAERSAAAVDDEDDAIEEVSSQEWPSAKVPPFPTLVTESGETAGAQMSIGAEPAGTGSNLAARLREVSTQR